MKPFGKRVALWGMAVSIISLCAIPAVRSALNPPLTPELEEGAGIIKSKQWALVLGKALFWDQQVGSNGMACASCHYHAGADTRIRNSLSPGFLQEPDPDTSFGSIGDYDGETVYGPVGQTKSGEYDPDATYQLDKDDFPFHHLSDYADRNSDILMTTNDVVSSSGQFDSTFFRVRRIWPFDKCSDFDGDVFHAGWHPARQVEPRNTPTTINAVFSYANFWDGRANNLFNGVGVFGLRDIEGDPRKRLVILDDSGNPQLGYLQIRNASLASQAVGPPLSEKEMSCEGRTLPDVGRKMLYRIPLALQKVAAGDSVLGSYRSPTGRGLKIQYLYSELIKKAFEDKYWKAKGRFEITADGRLKKTLLKGYTQMELNFSMYYGISIMLYEATLISDQSKFDTWFASCRPRVTNTGDPNAVPIANPTVTCADGASPIRLGFTEEEVLGFGLFNNGGVGIRNPGSTSCSGCHPVTNPNPTPPTPFLFPTFSEAQFQAGQNFVPVERSRIDLARPASEIVPNCITNANTPPGSLSCGGVHDRGFFNIGVTPTSFDLGNGGLDPYGDELSIARMFLKEQAGEAVADPSGIGNRCATPTLIEPGGTPQFPGCPNTSPPLLDATKELELVAGTFKTPSVRNVGLTPPYFHNGGYSTLRQVVEFYARGGSRRDKSKIDPSYTGDTSGTGPLGKDILPLPSTITEYGTNVDFFVREIKSTEEQIDAMTAFMLTLTDQRVQCDAAPFDHPSLFILKGHRATDLNKDGKADDMLFELPAVGAGGYSPSSAFCIPNTGDLFTPGMQARSGG